MPSLTMGWGWWLSHPLPTVITSCLAFPTSSDTGGHTPLLESTAHTPRVLLGHPFHLPPRGPPPPQIPLPALGAVWSLGHHEKHLIPQAL